MKNKRIGGEPFPRNEAVQQIQNFEKAFKIIDNAANMKSQLDQIRKTLLDPKMSAQDRVEKIRKILNQ